MQYVYTHKYTKTSTRSEIPKSLKTAKYWHDNQRNYFFLK